MAIRYESEDMSPVAYRLLGEKIEKRRQTIAEEKSQLEGLFRGDAGDGYHDSLFQGTQTSIQVAEKELAREEIILSRAKIIQPPKNNSVVQLGHLVTVRIFDDEVEEILHVHVLGTQDAVILSGQLEGEDEMLVSPKSPLGSALIGVKNGATVRYGTGAGMHEATILSISVSPFLHL